MNKERIKLWVDALRSGDYKQTSGALARKNLTTNDFSYCCLGVACEIAGLEKEECVLTDHITYNSAGGSLPREAAEWFGIRGYTNDFGVLPHIDGKTLSSMNDHGKSFEEIAQLIEDSWLNEGI